MGVLIREVPLYNGSVYSGEVVFEIDTERVQWRPPISRPFPKQEASPTKLELHG